MTPQDTVLLVVDVQEAAVSLDPWEGDAVIGNIAALIRACRASGVEVVHVQHDGAAGEDTEPGAPGWEIHGPVAPAGGERVFRKRYNSAFRGTGLQAYLDERGIDRIVLVGIQTEYCVDTTCRVAFELGFAVVMPTMTNTTFDNGPLSASVIHEYWNERIFAGRFAEVVPIEDALRSIGRGGAPA